MKNSTPEVYAFKVLEDYEAQTNTKRISGRDYYLTDEALDESEWVTPEMFRIAAEIFGSFEDAEDMSRLMFKSVPTPNSCGEQHLYFYRRPLYTFEGRNCVEEFAACIKDSNGIIGLMTGYAALGSDLGDFFNDYMRIFDTTVVRRSWRQACHILYEGYDMDDICDLADKAIPADLQQKIVDMIIDRLKKDGNLSPYLVLVSDVYVNRHEREGGVFSDLMKALELYYGDDYSGVFYLTPKKETDGSTAAMRLFKEYSATDYDPALNLALAESYGMKVHGDERPIAYLGDIFAVA